MSKQDEPERGFVVVEKKSVMRELHDKPEHPNLVAGADMSVMSFFDDVLRWIDRRRGKKARKRQMHAEHSPQQKCTAQAGT